MGYTDSKHLLVRCFGILPAVPVRDPGNGIALAVFAVAGARIEVYVQIVVFEIIDPGIF
jgi:hypothetical protein